MGSGFRVSRTIRYWKELGSSKIWMKRTRRGSMLYGVPFSVKDCIDVATMQTTAACPGFAYTAQRSATVVERLLGAGAILIGKTNLDQFQSGLVGTRTPYGVPRNPFDARYVPGGSSSGSAVSVSSGLVNLCAWNRCGGIRPRPGRLQQCGRAQTLERADQRDGMRAGSAVAGLRPRSSH